MAAMAFVELVPGEEVQTLYDTSFPNLLESSRNNILKSRRTM